MTDRLDELAVFVAILDAGSLAGAGRRLRRSPPAVTRTLAALEARLGARLVERTTRRLMPTEAGQRLGEQARRALAAYDEAVGGAMDRAPRGLLRITAPLVFGRRHVMPVVTSFLAAYPALRVEVMLSDRYRDLIEEGLEVALRIGSLPASGMVARPLGHVRRLLVASPDYLSRHATPTVPVDLANHTTIATESRGEPLEWRFRRAGRDQTVRLVPRLQVNDVDATLLAVRAGHGIGRALSYQVADDLAAGTLVRLMPEWELPPLPVQLVVPSARHMPVRVRVFLDHAVPRLAALAVLRDINT